MLSNFYRPDVARLDDDVFQCQPAKFMVVGFAERGLTIARFNTELSVFAEKHVIGQRGPRINHCGGDDRLEDGSWFVGV